MKICTGCKKLKIMVHGRKCKECRSTYLNKQWIKRNRKICPICKSEHNKITKECSMKCKILNRHTKHEECWNWIGKINISGYGCFQEKKDGNKKEYLSHRES